MKKVFLLPKGLDKFSTKELKNMHDVLGGTVPDVIYFPTSGGRRCIDGQVWSETLGRCVVVEIEVAVRDR